MRKDRLENIATVLWRVRKGEETITEISRNTPLSIGTCSDIFKFLHENFIGMRFKDYKKVMANIYGNSQPSEISVVFKPLEWNQKIDNFIMEFIKNPTQRKFIELKRTALRLFSFCQEKWGKLGRGFREKISNWIKNISPVVLEYFNTWSPP